MTRTALLFALALALVVVACGGADDAADPPTTATAPGVGAPIPGGGLSIEEALASTLEGPLMVKGHLVAPEDEQPRLCSALLESYPPQCGEPSLTIVGLDLSELDGLTRTKGHSLAPVTWSDGEISLLGAVEGGVLTVSATSS